MYTVDASKTDRKARNVCKLFVLKVLKSNSYQNPGPLRTRWIPDKNKAQLPLNKDNVLLSDGIMVFLKTK